MEIATTCGAFEQPFYGEVVIKIKGGDIVLTKVSQEFIAEPKT